MSLYVAGRLVCRFGWNLSSIQICTLDGHLHRVTYARCPINTIDPPHDGHRGARNMYRIWINIYEKGIVHQVGYSQELNRDARSTKHKIRVNVGYVFLWKNGGRSLIIHNSLAPSSNLRSFALRLLFVFYASVLWCLGVKRSSLFLLLLWVMFCVSVCVCVCVE